ncbi:MAG TPA: nucleotide exchange factor GrpE [Vicinamibacteria bacterium]|nr:nucleotide exchange factor GrpE [Vicinamibacteria bacterium]
MSGNGEDEKDDASAQRTVDSKRAGASPRRTDDPEAAEPSGLEAVEPRPEVEVEALRREAADLRDQLLRKRADFENFRRRTERDRDQIGQEKAAQVLKALIQPIDNLERALAAATEDDPLKQGVEMILKELMGVLEANGVTVEDPVGQPFDPLRHQALSIEPAPGHEDGTVTEVFSKGYALKDRLLRPALVKVAQGSGDPERASSGEKVH